MALLSGLYRQLTQADQFPISSLILHRIFRESIKQQAKLNEKIYKEELIPSILLELKTFPSSLSLDFALWSIKQKSIPIYFQISLFKLYGCNIDFVKSVIFSASSCIMPYILLELNESSKRSLQDIFISKLIYNCLIDKDERFLVDAIDVGNPIAQFALSVTAFLSSNLLTKMIIIEKFTIIKKLTNAAKRIFQLIEILNDDTDISESISTIISKESDDFNLQFQQIESPDGYIRLLANLYGQLVSFSPTRQYDVSQSKFSLLIIGYNLLAGNLDALSHVCSFQFFRLLKYLLVKEQSIMPILEKMVDIAENFDEIEKVDQVLQSFISDIAHPSILMLRYALHDGKLSNPLLESLNSVVQLPFISGQIAAAEVVFQLSKISPDPEVLLPIIAQLIYGGSKEMPICIAVKIVESLQNICYENDLLLDIEKLFISIFTDIDDVSIKLAVLKFGAMFNDPAAEDLEYLECQKRYFSQIRAKLKDFDMATGLCKSLSGISPTLLFQGEDLIEWLNWAVENMKPEAFQDFASWILTDEISKMNRSAIYNSRFRESPSTNTTFYASLIIHQYRTMPALSKPPIFSVMLTCDESMIEQSGDAKKLFKDALNQTYARLSLFQTVYIMDAWKNFMGCYIQEDPNEMQDFFRKFYSKLAKETSSIIRANLLLALTAIAINFYENGYGTSLIESALQYAMKRIILNDNEANFEESEKKTAVHSFMWIYAAHNFMFDIQDWFDLTSVLLTTDEISPLCIESLLALGRLSMVGQRRIISSRSMAEINMINNQCNLITTHLNKLFSSNDDNIKLAACIGIIWANGKNQSSIHDAHYSLIQSYVNSSSYDVLKNSQSDSTIISAIVRGRCKSSDSVDISAIENANSLYEAAAAYGVDFLNSPHTQRSVIPFKQFIEKLESLLKSKIDFSIARTCELILGIFNICTRPFSHKGERISREPEDYATEFGKESTINVLFKLCQTNVSLILGIFEKMSVLPPVDWGFLESGEVGEISDKLQFSLKHVIKKTPTGSIIFSLSLSNLLVNWLVDSDLVRSNAEIIMEYISVIAQLLSVHKFALFIESLISNFMPEQLSSVLILLANFSASLKAHVVEALNIIKYRLAFCADPEMFVNFANCIQTFSIPLSFFFGDEKTSITIAISLFFSQDKKKGISHLIDLPDGSMNTVILDCICTEYDSTVLSSLLDMCILHSEKEWFADLVKGYILSISKNDDICIICDDTHVLLMANLLKAYPKEESKILTRYNRIFNID